MVYAIELWSYVNDSNKNHFPVLRNDGFCSAELE